MGGKLVVVTSLALLVSAPLAQGDTGGLATATLSSTAPGAAAALTIGLHSELQCGRLVARTLTVRLPSKMRVPARIAARNVTVGGRPAARVAVAGSTVFLTIPLVKGAICNVIGPGVYRVVFGRRAGLVNPAAAGSYPFQVTAGPRGTAWRGTFRVG